jgi:hypothetical protein
MYCTNTVQSPDRSIRIGAALLVRTRSLPPSSLHHQTTKMPAVLSIELGIVPGVELTPSKRNKIVGGSLFGATSTRISKVTRIPLSNEFMGQEAL